MFSETNNPPFPAGKVSNDLDGFNQGEGDAEARGGDHRPIQDNGTGGRTSNVAGENTFRGDYPLPKDPNAPPGIDTDSSGSGEQIADFGLNETREVGTGANVTGSEYGITGEGSPPAGGGDDRNTKA